MDELPNFSYPLLFSSIQGKEEIELCEEDWLIRKEKATYILFMIRMPHFS